MCRLFWDKCKTDSYSDVTDAVLSIKNKFELSHTSDVYDALNDCYVYDARYQCEVCQRLRRISYPIEIKHDPKLPYRCDECSTLVE